jgi:hypothetical protein
VITVSLLVVGVEGEGTADPIHGRPLQQITVSATGSHSRTRVIELHGTQTTTQFQVEGKVRLVPCSGIYYFDSVGARLDSSAVYEYVATIRLSALSASAKGRRCGKSLPAGAGTTSASFSIVGDDSKDKNRQVSLHGTRHVDGWIHGSIDHLDSLCVGRYRLTATFARTHAVFSYEYLATVTKATVNGQPQTC